MDISGRSDRHSLDFSLYVPMAENQKLLIADAERQGVDIIHDFVPEYSFGRTCLAIAPSLRGVWTNAISDSDYGNNFLIFRD